MSFTQSQQQDRESEYLDWLNTSIVHDHKILTPEQRKKYCLIFGERVLQHYDTLRAALDDQHNRFSSLLTVLYVPGGAPDAVVSTGPTHKV